MVGEPGKLTGLRFVNPENKPAIFRVNIVKFPRKAWGVDVGARLHRTTINLLMFVLCIACIFISSSSFALTIVASLLNQLVTNTTFSKEHIVNKIF